MEAFQCTEPCRYVQDSLQRFKPGIIKQKKGDLSDCECNVVVGAGVFQKLLLYEDFPTRSSLDLRYLDGQNYIKAWIHPTSVWLVMVMVENFGLLVYHH